MLVTRVYFRDGYVDLDIDGYVLDYTTPSIPSNVANCVDVTWLQYCVNHCIIQAFAQFVCDDEYCVPEFLK